MAEFRSFRGKAYRRHSYYAKMSRTLDALWVQNEEIISSGILRINSDTRSG